MSANPLRHLIRWLPSFAWKPARDMRERRFALVGNKYGTRAAGTVIATAPPGTRAARPGIGGGPLGSVYTVRFFWIGACPWMTKTIAPCSKRISVRVAHAGVSAATAMHSNWPPFAA
ncbi:hypothetical protein BDI4_380074 [Burkholderia diffusa]|nr:hypothetical protein BDI4_380074 [Burkholderia diffusa]